MAAPASVAPTIWERSLTPPSSIRAPRRRRGLPVRAPRIVDLVLLHLAVQRRPVEAQDRGRLLLVPVGPLERLHDRHLLDVRQRPVRREDELRGARRPLPQ